MEFKTHEEFFKNVGNHYIHPTSYGEEYWHPSIEEMYQHFKARLMKEIHADSPGGILVERDNGHDG